jgi:hypothetical protein
MRLFLRLRARWRSLAIPLKVFPVWRAWRTAMKWLLSRRKGHV